MLEPVGDVAEDDDNDQDDDEADPMAPSDPRMKIDPTVKALIDALERTTESASAERRESHAAFVGTVGRLEAKLDTQTRVMAVLVAGIVVFNLALLGSIAGAVTIYRGGGQEIRVGEAAVQEDASHE